MNDSLPPFVQVLKTPVLVAFRQASSRRNALFNKHFCPQDDQPKAMQAGGWFKCYCPPRA